MRWEYWRLHVESFEGRADFDSDSDGYSKSEEGMNRWRDGVDWRDEGEERKDQWGRQRIECRRKGASL